MNRKNGKQKFLKTQKSRAPILSEIGSFQTFGHVEGPSA